jgi:hypothetical protein
VQILGAMRSCGRGNRLRRRRVEFLDFMSTRTCISTSRRRGPLGSNGGSRSYKEGGSFTSFKQLRKDIDAFIEAYNQNPKPFVWTKAKVHQRCVKGY